MVMVEERNVMDLKNKIKKYLSKSHCCLNCGSENIEGGHVDVDAGGATQDISCIDCNATWTDLYKLDYVVNIDIPGGNEDGKTMVAK